MAQACEAAFVLSGGLPMNTDLGNVAMSTSARKSIDDLLAVMAALRTPGSGCPWDLEQTFKTIAPYTIEEAYEVADAIDKGDMPALEGRAGRSPAAGRLSRAHGRGAGAFAFADVRRGHHRQDDPPPPARVRHRRPSARPAPRRASGNASRPRKRRRQACSLAACSTVSQLRSQRSRAPSSCRTKPPSVGFDWPSLAPVFDKLQEELAELEQAMAASVQAGRCGDRDGDRRRSSATCCSWWPTSPAT